MRTILIIVLGLFITQTLSAQNDSLIIKLNDYGQLLIINSNLVTKKRENLKLDETYSEFYTRFKPLLNVTSFTKEGYFIKFKSGKYRTKNFATINIVEKDKEPDKYYFYKEQVGTLLDYKFKISLSPKVFLFLDSLDDFERVTNLSLDSIYKQSQKNVPLEALGKKMPHLFFYNSNNGKLDEQSRFIYSGGKSQNFIEIYPSFGMQIINSSFAPEININLDFDLGNKGQTGQKFGLSTTFLIMPDKNDFFNVSNYNFINANYYIKMRNKLTHKISIGYLYGRTGNDFGENTWNGYWQTTVNKVGIKLGGFYTKNNEGNYVVVPSIGFNFGF